ncbi:unnamed protein product [Effrenium voratum]|nr:unnamed protein product [Effrenium voratum]
MERYGHGKEAGLPSFQKYLKFMEFQNAQEHTPELNYEDYSQYLNKNGDGISPQEFLDYHQYMDNHAQFEDFSKYLKLQGKDTPSYGEYLNFQQYTGGQQPDAKQYSAQVPSEYQKYSEYQKMMPSDGPAMLAAEVNESDEETHASHESEKSEKEKSKDKKPKEEANKKSGESGYQQYMDYKKYMDYQKYMDWSKYTSGGGDGPVSYQQYMDYQRLA